MNASPEKSVFIILSCFRASGIRSESAGNVQYSYKVGALKSNTWLIKSDEIICGEL